MKKRHRVHELDILAAITRRTSPIAAEAFANIREELDTIGFPSSGGGPKVSGSRSSDSTGEQASRAYDLTQGREDLRDAIVDLGDRVTLVHRLARRWVPQDRPAMTEARCSDAWHGREGSDIWSVDDRCEALPDTRGLCTLHYHRERRWRIAEGLPTREEPAA